LTLYINPAASNQEMKPTSPRRNSFGVFAAALCRDLSLSR
jgi:hypothetical protein